MRISPLITASMLAIILSGCVTEEVAPPAIHTSAYVASGDEEAPAAQASPAANNSPAPITNASTDSSSKRAPEPSAPPISAVPPPPGR